MARRTEGSTVLSRVDAARESGYYLGACGAAGARERLAGAPGGSFVVYYSLADTRALHLVVVGRGDVLDLTLLNDPQVRAPPRSRPPPH